jgi:hypothetical protein
MIEVVSVLVLAGDRKHTGPQNVCDAVSIKRKRLPMAACRFGGIPDKFLMLSDRP